MIPSFWRDTITRLRAPLIEDGYESPASERDWARAQELEIGHCSVQPGPASEYAGEGRDAQRAYLQIFAPAGADILGTDRIQWAGLTWEVDGDGRECPSATGLLDHVEIRASRVVG